MSQHSPRTQEYLLRSIARTVGEFGIPEDAAHSNHEAEERLADVIRRRRESIAAGAEADTLATREFETVVQPSRH